MNVTVQSICRNKLIRVLKLCQNTELLAIYLSRAVKVFSNL